MSISRMSGLGIDAPEGTQFVRGQVGRAESRVGCPFLWSILVRKPSLLPKSSNFALSMPLLP